MVQCSRYYGGDCWIGDGGIRDRGGYEMQDWRYVSEISSKRHILSPQFFPHTLRFVFDASCYRREVLTLEGTFSFNLLFDLIFCA